MSAEGAPAGRIGRRVAVAATVLAASLLATPASVVAAPAGPPAAAYWWQPEPVSGLIPVPGVPSNGMYVASSPTGPQAESAIRFDVADPTAEVRVTFRVSMQERVGKPAIVAYPATRHWQTGGPQTWSARPTYRATPRAAKGVFSHNGSVMTLTFPARDAAIGVVLLPDPTASNPTFTIAFAPPTSADIAVRRTATSSPSASSSPKSPSHSASPRPHGSSHSSSPSSHSPHPSKSAKPPRHSPTPTTTPGHPSPSASASPTVAAAHSSGHGTVIVVTVIAVVLIAGAIGAVVVAARRRRS